MDNPWQHLPATAPFVLEGDKSVIEKFNTTATPQAYIHWELLPEPFLGRPDAPVVLLNLNPGFSLDDIHQHKNPHFVQMCRNNLTHTEINYPFYLLDPQVGGPGYLWWQRKLKALLQEFDSLIVAQTLLCIEYFPYHSLQFHHHKLFVESQKYSFSLVQAAIRRNATIILMRSEKLWYNKVPELLNYSKLYKLINVQNPTISQGNCPDGYIQIVTAIKEYENRIKSFSL